MTTQLKPVTAEELLNMPDDGCRYELVKGELRKIATASFSHGTSAMKIGAPDLVMEVISPNDRLAQVTEKVRDWLQSGSRMVMVVNPRKRNVTVHLPNRARTILT